MWLQAALLHWIIPCRDVWVECGCQNIFSHSFWDFSVELRIGELVFLFIFLIVLEQNLNCEKSLPCPFPLLSNVRLQIPDANTRWVRLVHCVLTQYGAVMLSSNELLLEESTMMVGRGVLFSGRGRKEDSFPPLLHHRTSSLDDLCKLSWLADCGGGCLNPHNPLPGNFSRCYFCSSSTLTSVAAAAKAWKLVRSPSVHLPFRCSASELSSPSWFTLLWGFLALGNTWVFSVQFLCIYWAGNTGCSMQDFLAHLSGVFIQHKFVGDFTLYLAWQSRNPTVLFYDISLWHSWFSVKFLCFSDTKQENFKLSELLCLAKISV